MLTCYCTCSIKQKVSNISMCFYVKTLKEITRRIIKNVKLSMIYIFKKKFGIRKA